MDEIDKLGYKPDFREEADKAKSDRKRAKEIKKAELSSEGSSTLQSRDFKLMLTVIAIVIMIVLTPLAGYIRTAKEPEVIDTKKVYQDEVIWAFQSELELETYYASVDVLTSSTVTELTRQELEKRIQSKLEFIIRSKLIPAYSKVDNWKLEPRDLSIYLHIVPLYTGSYHELVNEKKSIQNSIDGSSNNEFNVVPGYYRVDADYQLLTTKIDDNTYHTERKMDYSVDIKTLLPFLEFSHDEFQLEAGTTQGRIQRMVTYMLTTLVRHRLKQEYGFGPYESPLNVLNEGDIELAVNIAVIFEQLSALKACDVDAVRAVDKYYISARDPQKHLDEPNWSPPNPTGQRYWGTSEMENFDKLNSYILNTGIDRSIEQQLISVLSKSEYLDPADMLSLYMVLDRELTGIPMDPTDDRSLLDDIEQWDPRRPADHTDAQGITTILNISANNVFEFIDELNFEGGNFEQILTVDQEPDFMVVGTDIFVEGLNSPNGWYTDIQLPKTRTVGVPPSSAPPSHHDFRVQWDLNIEGEFQLNLGAPWAQTTSSIINYGLNEPPAFFTHDTWYNNTVHLNFPVTIYGWPVTLPLNNAIFFENLNPNLYDFVNDTWIQRPSAQVKEFFSEKLWSSLKPILELKMAKATRELDLFKINSETNANFWPSTIQIESSDQLFRMQLNELIEALEPSFWQYLDLFSNFYLRNYTELKQFQDLNGPELWLWEDGYNITIGFSDDFKDVTFTFVIDGIIIVFLTFHDIEPTGSITGVEMLSSKNLFDNIISTSLTQNTFYFQFIKTGQYTEVETTGLLREGIFFNVNFIPYQETYMPPLFNSNKPELLLSFMLPQIKSAGQSINMELKFGLYNSNALDTDLNVYAESLSKDIFNSAGRTFGPLQDGITESISEAQLDGFFTDLFKSLNSNKYMTNGEKLTFAINLSTAGTGVEASSVEFGLYVEGSTSSVELVQWLSVNYREFISSLKELPYSSVKISNLFNNKSNTLSLNFIEDSQFYIILDSEEIYALAGWFEGFLRSNGNNRIPDGLSTNFIVDINPLKTRPAYKIENTLIPQDNNIGSNLSINILRSDDEFIPEKTLRLVFIF